jgi:hypothetical protein
LGLGVLGMPKPLKKAIESALHISSASSGHWIVSR